MNIPKPVTVKNYNKTVSRKKEVVKTVAEETMRWCSQGNIWHVPSTDDIVNSRVSGEGTCERKWFSSFNGMFAAIYIQSGKVLDVEPMSRYCKGCNLKKDSKVKNPTAYAEWKKYTYMSIQLQRFCRRYGG